MLQAIRDRAKGWVAYVIIGLLAVPFALFGVYNYYTGGGDPTVAEVNGTEITRAQLDNATRQQQNRLREILGERYDPAVFDEATLRRQALNRLIDRLLLTDFVESQGFRLTDAALRQYIGEQSVFQVDGQFSAQRYREVLRQNGMTPELYESRLRSDRLLAQVQDSVAASALVTEDELSRVVALQRQERDVAWARVSAEAFRSQVDITPEAVRQYYADNKEVFRQPEQARLDYVLLSRDTLSDRVDIDEAALKQRYEELKETRFTTAGAKQVRHILIEVAEGADDAGVEAARERLVELRQRIEQGADFGELAREHSDDIGSAEQGGDLGFIGKGDMVPAFEQAAFALERGQLSEPVRSEFGWHLIEVTDTRPGETRPFEAVREELRRELAVDKVANRFYELSNEMANLAYENPDSLEPVSQALDLPIQQTPWFSRDGADEGLAAREPVVEAAFSEDVLGQRLNSELIELGDDSMVMVRVAEHRPAQVRPLEAVEPAVRKRLERQRMAELAQERGQALLEEAKSGGDLTALASDDAVSTATPGWVDRQGGNDLPSPLVARAFRLDHPQQGQSSLGGLALAGGDYAVIAVRGVRDGDLNAVSPKQREQMRSSLRQLDAQGSFEDLLATLRAEADVSIRQDRL